MWRAALVSAGIGVAVVCQASAGPEPFAGVGTHGVTYLQASVSSYAGKYRQGRAAKDAPKARASDVMLSTVKIEAMVRGRKLDKSSARALCTAIADKWKRFPVERVASIEVAIATDAWEEDLSALGGYSNKDFPWFARYVETREFGPAGDDLHVVPTAPWTVQDGAWRPTYLTPALAKAESKTLPLK